MKLALAILAFIFILFCLTGCKNFPPVKAKVCYETPGGTICAGTDGKSVVIDGTVKGEATLTFKK